LTFIFGRRRTLPGFGPTLGMTVLYLSLLVLIPLSGLFVKAASLSWAEWWQVVTAPRAMAAYRLTIGASAAAAAINMVFGVLLAWLLVRHPIPGRRICEKRLSNQFFAFPFCLLLGQPAAVAKTNSTGSKPLTSNVT
jgi:sulfate transport system permease protein